MANKNITKSKFHEILSTIKISTPLNEPFLYSAFLMATESIQALINNQILFNGGNINYYEVIYYLIGEYVYTTNGMNEDNVKKFLKSEKSIASIASVAADKYLTLAVFSHNEGKVANEYYPPISSLRIYNNFMLKIFEGYQRNNPKVTLIVDLLSKSLSIVQCIISLLVQGYETEALASWRTLHECECTLMLLNKHHDLAINAYLKHMRYGIAYKDGIADKKEQDQVFTQIKEEMKKFDLKSKDMKKYIEYGWLTAIKDIKEDPTFKFNFRDGLEKIAGLERYSDIYQLSSEILHSTPLLIYSNKNYFYYLTLLSTYESFFRLENIFLSLFIPYINEEGKKRFSEMRHLYLSQLMNIHKRETIIFIQMFGKKPAESVEKKDN